MKFTDPTFNQLLTLAKLNNNLTDQLMKSIRELHQKVGVYHGDMGPRNIYITSSNSIKFIYYTFLI